MTPCRSCQTTHRIVSEYAHYIPAPKVEQMLAETKECCTMQTLDTKSSSSTVHLTRADLRTEVSARLTHGILHAAALRHVGLSRETLIRDVIQLTRLYLQALTCFPESASPRIAYEDTFVHLAALYLDAMKYDANDPVGQWDMDIVLSVIRDNVVVV